MDSAFPTAAYPSYTTAELERMLADGGGKPDIIRDEMARRAEVRSGNMARATAGERLRAVRAASA